MKCLTTLIGVVFTGIAYAGENAADPLPANTWTKISVDWQSALPPELPDARWVTTDGYSDNVYRCRTDSVIIRTGVHSDSAGFSPGFYTNASVEWDLKTDTVRVIDVVPWGGGSYGRGKLLDGYRPNKAPSPRHTYDGICYVPETDEMYMMLGAYGRMHGSPDYNPADDEAKAELDKDRDRTWVYSFEKKRWTCIEDNAAKHVRLRSIYETHLTHWPEGGKLLFFDDGGNRYAQFDLKTRQWAEAATANPCPMSLYNARSAWDAKRALWIFRLGPRVCTFDPATGLFEELPHCYEMEIPSRDELRQMQEDGRTPDPRLGSKGIAYIARHDRYIVCGPTGNDTAVYDPETKRWTPIRGGDIELANGYMQYSPGLDLVAMNFQQQTYKFRYVREE